MAIKEQIKDSILRYGKSLDSYKHQLSQWKNIKNNTPENNTEAKEYWEKNISLVEPQIEMIEGFIKTLHSFLN